MQDLSIGQHGWPIQLACQMGGAISCANQYDEPTPRSWLADIYLVWQLVPDLNVYFGSVAPKMQEEKAAKYPHASISAAIQPDWELRNQGSSLHYSRPKTTRSAFSTQEITFNGEEASIRLSPRTDATTGVATDVDSKSKPRWKEQKPNPKSSG